MRRCEVAILAAGLTAAALLAGCGAGPTYGTGRTSSQQFMDDLSNLVSFRSPTSNVTVDIRPRPALVRPDTDAVVVLPPPQQNVELPGKPDSPESPASRRKNLRNEATANRDNSAYVPPAVGETGRRSGIGNVHGRQEMTPDPARARAMREEYRRLRQQAQGGSATQRRYLSEPPVIYRQPAATAPVGVRGEDEVKKERRRKAGAG